MIQAFLPPKTADHQNDCVALGEDMLLTHVVQSMKRSLCPVRMRNFYVVCKTNKRKLCHHTSVNHDRKMPPPPSNFSVYKNIPATFNLYRKLNPPLKPLTPLPLGTRSPLPKSIKIDSSKRLLSLCATFRGLKRNNGIFIIPLFPVKNFYFSINPVKKKTLFQRYATGAGCSEENFVIPLFQGKNLRYSYSIIPLQPPILCDYFKGNLHS